MEEDQNLNVLLPSLAANMKKNVDITIFQRGDKVSSTHVPLALLP